MSPPAGFPPKPIRLTSGPEPILRPARAAAASKRSRSPGPPPATRTEPGTSGPAQGPDTTVTADADTWADKAAALPAGAPAPGVPGAGEVRACQIIMVATRCAASSSRAAGRVPAA